MNISHVFIKTTICLNKPIVP